MIKPRDLDVLLTAVGLAQNNTVVAVDSAAFNATDPDTPDIIVIIQTRKQHLQGRVNVTLGRVNIFQNGLKQRAHIPLTHIGIQRRIAVFCRSVHHGEVDLVVVRTKLDKQIQDLVHDLGRPRTGAIDLIDDHNNLFIQRQRLAQHETRLRHTALERIYQEQNAVHHCEDALHFAAEVGMAGRVYDIDLHAVIMYGCVFGQNRDTALAFKGIGVHYALLHDLVLPKDTALLQKLVHQRSLAMVNVGDDRDIP